MPPPLYASTTLAGKPWSRWSAELLGRWSSWVSMRAFGHRWSTTVLVLRRCIETTGIGACTAEGLAPTRPRSRRMPPNRYFGQEWQAPDASCFVAGTTHRTVSQSVTTPPEFLRVLRLLLLPSHSLIYPYRRIARFFLLPPGCPPLPLLPALAAQHDVHRQRLRRVFRCRGRLL